MPASFDFSLSDPAAKLAARKGYVRTLLRDITTEAQIGLHPWEQHPERPTRLVVNVELFVPLGTAGLADLESEFVDYDPIRRAIKSWPTRPHTFLLETLLKELVDLCFANPRVAACRVSVVKPDIFNEVAAAGVEVFVERPDS